MADKFLYETLDSISQMGFLNKEMPRLSQRQSESQL